MIIRKLFEFNGMHIVRDCSSDRCKKSLHSHTYCVELKFTADNIDNGQMIMDFGLMKGGLKDIIKSFDKSYSMWNKESSDYKQLVTSHYDRWIEMPVSPSAEMYSLMFFVLAKRVIEKTKFNNGENNVRIHSVICHETTTGYAESFQEDYDNIWVKNGYTLEDIKFSQQIKDEWTDTLMWGKLLDVNTDYAFINPEIKLKYNV